MYDINLKDVPLDWREARIPKPNKPGEFRHLTIPNDRLKTIQRGILKESLYNVDALKPTSYAYGFVPFKSCLEAVQAHDRKADFFCMDAKDFFDTFPVEVVRKQLLKGGLEEEYVDKMLTACSYNNKLPQGSPASPCLTNIGMLDVDKMLGAFADSIGATFTRYADDLVFSINFANKGLPYKKRGMYIFKSVDARLYAETGVHLNWKKCHIIPYKGKVKRQVLGICIRLDGLGYNAPGKLRRTARAMCCNLWRKLKQQHWRPQDGDWAAWARLKGTVHYLDYVRSGSDDCVAGADSRIQEKFWNDLLRVFDGKNRS